MSMRIHFPFRKENIRLIIIENDYENIEHYNYVKNKLDTNFNCVENLPLNNPP